MDATSSSQRHSLLRRYGFAAICILSATLLCWASGRLFDSQIPFMLFILATVLAAWHGGLGAGLATLVAGVILGDYVFLSPPSSAAHHGPAEITLLLTYGGTTLIAILLIHALRKARCLAQKAALALAETERMYRCLVEESLVGIYLIQDGHFRYVNSRLAQIFGYAQDEVAGRPVPDLVAPDDRHLVLENLHKRLSAQIKSIQYEFRGQRKDGRIIDVEVIGTTTLYNGKVAVLGSLLDITERKRALEALRLSEEHFRQVFEDSPIGAAIVSLDRHYQRVNDVLCRITGYSKEELTRLSIDDITHPDDRPVDHDGTRRMGSGETDHFQTDKRYVRKDGATVWVHVSACLMRDASEKPLCFLAMMEDITDRKLAEAQLRQSKEAAEAADRAKDRFLAVLSHELRTPLTPVLAAASLMQKDQSLPPEVLSNFAMIHRNVALEATLIDDLLDITRISKGKLELRVQTVDIRALLRRTVEICSADIAAGRLRLTLDIDNGPRCVRGDASRLQQVFWNLLRNAIKFTPEGGSIAIRCSDGSGTGSRVPGVDCVPPLSPGFCPKIPNPNRQTRSIIVEVSDTGIGIEPGQIGRLFEAFEQGDRAVTRKFGGLGLGLAICKALVNLHGGQISAMSRGQGQGATFRVELPMCSLQLPACQSASGDGPARPVSERAPQRNLRLLLVEDHADTARIMRQLLEHDGHAVRVAHDVASALDLARRYEFDVLISDLGLPDGSGLDLIRQLTAERRRPNAIALSGYGMEDDIRQSREAGFLEHLTKPVEIERLQAAIGRAAAARSPAVPSPS